jgi:hypothetical protein
MVLETAAHWAQWLQRTEAGGVLELGMMGKSREHGAQVHYSAQRCSRMRPHSVAAADG